MANRRKDRVLPEGFVRYDGNYVKQYYDVFTFNGVIYPACWPNAGMFHVVDGSGRRILKKEVLAIRGNYDQRY